MCFSARATGVGFVAGVVLTDVYKRQRRIWAKVMRDRFQAKNPRSWILRTHAQTAGVSLMAQQPLNNVCLLYTSSCLSR